MELNVREFKQTGEPGMRDSKKDQKLDAESGETQQKKALDEVERINRADNVHREITRIESFNYSDPREFARSLGIPYKNLEVLLHDHHERDHLVAGSLHEEVSFTKIQEGYPQFLYRTAKLQNKIKFSEQSDECEVLDFYEGLQIMPKVIAAIQKAF